MADFDRSDQVFGFPTWRDVLVYAPFIWDDRFITSVYGLLDQIWLFRALDLPIPITQLVST